MSGNTESRSTAGTRDIGLHHSRVTEGTESEDSVLSDLGVDVCGLKHSSQSLRKGQVIEDSLIKVD